MYDTSWYGDDWRQLLLLALVPDISMILKSSPPFLLLFWTCLLFSSPASCFHLSLPPIPSVELSDNPSPPPFCPFKDTARLPFPTADSLISPPNRLSYPPHCLAPLCSTDWSGNPPDFLSELVSSCSWGGFFSFFPAQLLADFAPRPSSFKIHPPLAIIYHFK